MVLPAVVNTFISVSFCLNYAPRGFSIVVRKFKSFPGCQIILLILVYGFKKSKKNFNTFIDATKNI